jgi:hypothetical protein
VVGQDSVDAQDELDPRALEFDTREEALGRRERERLQRLDDRAERQRAAAGGRTLKSGVRWLNPRRRLEDVSSSPDEGTAP